MQKFPLECLMAKSKKSIVENNDVITDILDAHPKCGCYAIARNGSQALTIHETWRPDICCLIASCPSAAVTQPWVCRTGLEAWR